jgi:hypothetical protein
VAAVGVQVLARPATARASAASRLWRTDSGAAGGKRERDRVGRTSAARSAPKTKSRRSLSRAA